MTVSWLLQQVIKTSNSHTFTSQNSTVQTSVRPSVRPTDRPSVDSIKREAQRRQSSVDGRIAALDQTMVHIPTNRRKRRERTLTAVFGTEWRRLVYCIAPADQLCVVVRHWLPRWDGLKKMHCEIMELKDRRRTRGAQCSSLWWGW